MECSATLFDAEVCSTPPNVCLERMSSGQCMSRKDPCMVHRRHQAHVRAAAACA